MTAYRVALIVFVIPVWLYTLLYIWRGVRDAVALHNTRMRRGFLSPGRCPLCKEYHP
jgi:hypothetical protein